MVNIKYFPTPGLILLRNASPSRSPSPPPSLLLGLSPPTADIQSSEKNPAGPAIAESSDSDSDEDEVQPVRKRPKEGAGAGRAGATKRRQIIEVSSDSDADIELGFDTVDLCDSSSDDDDDDDEDSDADSSDANDNAGGGGSGSTSGKQPATATRKPALKGMGDLTIPPFRGGSGAAGRGAKEIAGGGSGGPTVVDLALSSDGSDSEGCENFIPLTRPPASSLSSGGVNMMDGPASNALQTGQQLQSNGGVLLIVPQLRRVLVVTGLTA